MEWQPIETAPRDGRQLLLCRAMDADGIPMDAALFGLFCQVASWDDDRWMVFCSLPAEPRLHFEPTHWSELAAGPLAGDLSQRPIHAGLWGAAGTLESPVCRSSGVQFRLVDVRDRDAITCRRCRSLLGLDRPS